MRSFISKQSLEIVSIIAQFEAVAVGVTDCTNFVVMLLILLFFKRLFVKICKKWIAEDFSEN